MHDAALRYSDATDEANGSNRRIGAFCYGVGPAATSVCTVQLPLDYAPGPDLLADKVIVVTGAGDGIGRAVSLALAAHGATVVLLGRTVKKLESTYDAIEAAGGPTPASFRGDLLGASPDHALKLAESLEQEFGRLDGVLHNASVLGSMTPIAHYDPETWLEVMQVNVNATFLLTRTLLPLLERVPDARVVFTSSGVGRAGRAYWGAYAVSKFATEGLMQVLADETENDGRVRVMSINPGRTRTRMRAAAYPAEDPNTLRRPEDIAPAYVYVFGPEGAKLHGRALDAGSKGETVRVMNLASKIILTAEVVGPNKVKTR